MVYNLSQERFQTLMMKRGPLPDIDEDLPPPTPLEETFRRKLRGLPEPVETKEEVDDLLNNPAFK